MNFLAHYEVGTMPNDPQYTLGCVLPDLVRNAQRDSRLKPRRPIATPSPLELGVSHHFLADKIFHSSGFFRQNSKALKQILTDNGYQDRRYGFFTAHIALELLLDRLLMKKDVLPLDLFYHYLSRITENDLVAAFQVYNLPNPEAFIPFFERFRRSRYLYYYQSMSGLTFALNLIHERVGLEPFENQGVSFLVEMDATIAKGGLSIIGEINKQILSDA